MARRSDFLDATALTYLLIKGVQINTHQYSATHFERDLSRGLAESNEGVYVMHGINGVPGESL